MRDSFILYANYEENFKMLSDNDKGKLIMAIFAFNRDEDISSTLKPLAKMAYVSITNQIKLNNEKYDKRCETSRQNGQLGGRPRKKSTENEENQQDFDNKVDEGNLKQPKKPNKTDRLLGSNGDNDGEKNLNNLKKPNENLKTLNDNEYDNDLLVNNKNNIYNNACVRTCVRDNSINIEKCFKDFYNEVYEYGLPDRLLKPANEIIDVMVDTYQQAQTPNGFKFNHTTYNASTLLDVFIKVDAYNFRSIINQLVFNESIENRPLYIMGCLIMASQDQKCSNTPEQIEVLRKALTSMPHTVETVNQQVQATPKTTAGE